MVRDMQANTSIIPRHFCIWLAKHLRSSGVSASVRRLHLPCWQVTRRMFGQTTQVRGGVCVPSMAAPKAARSMTAAEKEGRVRVGDRKADGDESVDRGAGVKRPLGRTIEVVEGARESQKEEGAGGRKQNDGGLGKKSPGKRGVDAGGSGHSRRKKRKKNKAASRAAETPSSVA